MKFQIGKDSTIFMGCTFDCSNNLSIGTNTIINANCRLDNRGGLQIGNNVSISNDVIILTLDHDMNSPHFFGRSRPVFIDDYVWIGTRAMILSGVTLKTGVVVGANSMVNKSVEEFIFVGGVPAKKIKGRNKDLVYKLKYRRLFQ